MQTYALHYLREYKKLDSLDNIAFREDAERIIVCPECHSELILLSESNNPLTWDELTMMVGQTIWIKHKEWGPYSYCFLLKKVHNFAIDVVYKGKLGVLAKYRNDDGTWQAYRKERE